MELGPTEIIILQLCAARPIAGLELSDSERQIVSGLVLDGLVLPVGTWMQPRFDLQIFMTGPKGLAMIDIGGSGQCQIEEV